MAATTTMTLAEAVSNTTTIHIYVQLQHEHNSALCQSLEMFHSNLCDVEAISVRMSICLS